MENQPKTPMRTFFRVVIVGAIILVLVFLSIGIVKIVPKVVSSLASATVSITSLFDGNATSTKANTSGGFVVVGNNATSTSSTHTATTTSNGSTQNTNQNTNTSTSNTSVTTSTNNSHSGGSSYNNGYTTNYTNGTPDVAVMILSKGVINPSNGAYVDTNNFTTSDTVVIKFKIENRGTAPTGTFNISVTMPASNSADQLRQITNVGSIPAGAAIEAQAVFTNPQIGNNLPVTITVDPSGLTRDSNRTNNVASIGLNVVQGSNYNGYNTGNNTTYGQPDFTVQILQVGTLDAYNRFIPSTNIPANGRVAVQFRVINRGNNANVSNVWGFRAELTDYPNANKIYNSDIQAGLVGGQIATFTLGFDNLRYGSNSITIYADSQNNVYENNENNNVGSVSFNVY
ncbi:MAG: CARDB domain-containing protein [bacterium]